MVIIFTYISATSADGHNLYLTDATTSQLHYLKPLNNNNRYVIMSCEQSAYAKTKAQISCATSNCKADQRLCFFSTRIVQNLKPLASFCDCTGWFVSDVGGN